jgi:di/tricarboxylate transporter
MVLTRCLSLADAYKAIEWRIIILIAGFMPLGTAIVKAGLVDAFVNTVLLHVADHGQPLIIGALFLLSSAIALVSTNIAAAILMGPVAMAASASLAMNPEMLLIAVAIGASNGFMTPVAQQANLLVMGPGNYVFKDYMKAGMFLSLLMFAAVMLFMSLFFRT